MAALSAVRNVPSRASQGPLSTFFLLKCKASTTFYFGGLVAVDTTTGLAEPATAASGKIVVGVSEPPPVSKQALASALFGDRLVVPASGTYYIQVRRGVFLFGNKGGDLVDDTLLGRPLAYVEDDQTVRATATSSVVAGRVIEVESAGVWVEVY